MKAFDDHAVSELLGYTILVGIVILAVISLTSTGTGAIYSTVKYQEFLGASGALKCLAHQVSSSAVSNNTFYRAYEMAVPAGYELEVKDRYDDLGSIRLLADDTPLTSLRTGSVKLKSPYRYAVFEGGAVMMNDTGILSEGRKPMIYTVGSQSGRDVLYISIVSIVSDTWTYSNGVPITLRIRCGSVKCMNWTLDGKNATLLIDSVEPGIWEKRLVGLGFSTEYENGTLKATSGKVAEIYVTYAEIGVTKEV
ncbi:hypothetical protein CUJ83_07340 [Methanocella sp. CWC-04]|uniref:Uncharacterized protein n=1 Tax=Methanooceanicella nereidis TaxID=2052831 RepID=A0AAP2RC28_9EURY|nr:hypothetical protein [Methanocella sp. CWC-04]MCD1294811.1 hypothetical protein [Methanocella sp. CWC-04]